MALNFSKSYVKFSSVHSSRFVSSVLIKDGSSSVQTSSGDVKSFSEIPGPLRIPLWGNLLHYKFGFYNSQKYHKVLEELHKKYGPLVKHFLGRRTQVIVFDPEDIKTIYKHEGPSPRIAPLQETTALYRTENGLSLGLGNTNGEDWYRLRSAVRQMMLRPKEVYYYLPFIQEVASDFVQQIEIKRNSEGELDDLILEASKWSQESAGIVCFEKRLGCMSGGKSEELAQLMIETNRKIFTLAGELKFSLPIYKYFMTPKKKQLNNAENVYYRKALAFVNEAIHNLEGYVKENGNLGDKYNFLGYLMSRKELSHKDVLIITFSLFTDGLSTTVPALMYNLYCLATNPQVQEKAYEEITSVWEKGSAITPEVINRMPYLKAVVKETFRLYPIGTETTRIVPKDLVLSGYHVPSGTELHLSPNVHFKSPEYIENPNEFSPERWLRGGETSIHPYLLTPFGHGIRTCAGRRFAEQDLYVVLCCILQKFKLQYPKSKPLEQVFNTLLFPDGPVRVQFIPRKQ
ncbi:probable cytochrome P450 CYP44 [Anabrus simplex]|uniref:probable cytochrome P450 CYP44 n=1 Tax=Anabrus simplex TaxID=316456 RepID=UPI0034DCF0F5